MELENTTDQTQDEKSTSDDNQLDTNKDSGDNTVDLGNGQTVTLDELKAGYMKGSDYTKKTQELSEKKKELDLSEEDLKAIDILKKAWFASVDDIANFKKEQSDKEDFSNFVWATDLSETQLKAVKDLRQVNPNKSYAEIAKEYWYIDEAKLNRFKGNSSIKWNSFALPEKQEQFKVDVTKAGYNPEQAAEVAKMKF